MTQYCSKAVVGDVWEFTGEAALVVVLKNAYIATILAVRDTALLASGTYTDLEQLYSIYCYSSMTSVYIKMLLWVLQPGMNNKYYSCYETNVGFSTRCIKNIAQLRVLGENAYYEYIESDAWFFGVGPLIDFATGLSDVKKALEINMAAVKSITDAMKIDLSSKLMYSVQ